MKLLAIIGLFPLFLNAHPTSFPDNIHTSVRYSKDSSWISSHYQFNSDTAVSLTQISKETPEKEFQSGLVGINKRLWRGNYPNRQSNLYGWVQAGELEGAALGYGIQADTETRKTYLSIVHQEIHSRFDYSMTEISSGFALNPSANYKDNAYWLMFKSEINSIDQDQKLTPFIRVINKGLFLEFGKELKGNYFTKMMFNFSF